MAKDVCTCLGMYMDSFGFPNVTVACGTLSRDETTLDQIKSANKSGKLQVSRVRLVTESGLYKLIMRSDKPAARKFQDWVTRYSEAAFVIMSPATAAPFFRASSRRCA